MLIVMGVEREILWHSSTYACMFSGLGDTNYSNFCNNARNIDRRLSQLGGQRFYPCGFADDAVGYAVFFLVCVCCLFGFGVFCSTLQPYFPAYFLQTVP